jgi:multicomponent Na+:H+ antiporter subunit E
MTMFAWNLLLALIWAIALGPLSARNLIIGFFVGFVAIAIGWRIAPGDRVGRSSNAYALKALAVLGFAWFFIKELVVANIRMARFTLGPTRNITAGIVAVPLEEMSDMEITILANLITLTPGTMSVDVATDRRCLYVHCMDASDPEAIRADIKEGFEARVIEVLR